MTDEEKRVLSRVFDIDFTDISSDENYKEISYIEKQQLKYIETHKKIEEYDVLTSIRRGEYKEIFNSYIDYCLEEGKKPKVRHLFHIYNEIKTFFTSDIALDAFINICNGEISYKEFFTDFDDLTTDDNFSLITGNWGKCGNSNVNITHSKLFDILKDFEYAIEKEIHKIDILFLKYTDLIEKQEEGIIEGKKKTLTDDDFKNYINEYLTPQNDTVDLIKKNTTLIIELLTNIQNKNTEPLPELESLNELIEGNDPVLRKWTNGKYKCTSLEEFIKRYIKIADNLTPALIRDYLISDKTGKQYSDNSIETSLKLYGLGRKSK